MGMMLPRINLFFHVLNHLVYSILSKPTYKSINYRQEKNDQAFSVSQ